MGLAALGSSLAASAETISDTELLVTSWSVAYVASGFGGGASSVRVSSGGNPDSMRRISFAVNAAPNGSTQSIIFAVHLRIGYIYNPATRGPLASFSLSEDVKRLDAVSNPQWTGVLLRQDGVYYISRGADTGGFNIWLPKSAGPYAAQDFVAIDTGDFVDGVEETVHPNFTATGSPIEVGFYRALASGIGGSVKSADFGLDNLVITITPAAPPACIGDLNGDNAVNTQDLTAFLSRFGTTVTPGGPGDFNNDGAVTTADLTTFLGRFGSAC